MRYFAGLVVLSCLFATCTEGHYYAKTISIEGGQWSYADTLEYEIEVIDTISAYDLMLNIHHSTEFAFQNIYLRIWTLFPDGTRLDQTLPIDFADSKGNWYGDCNATACDLVVVLQENAHFNQTGIHQFKIAQFMRMDSLKGVSAIEMMVDQRGPQASIAL